MDYPKERILVPVTVKKEMDVSVSMESFVEVLNDLPVARRWNYVASLLNHILLEEEAKELEPQQIDMVKKWLNDKLKKLKA